MKIVDAAKTGPKMASVSKAKGTGKASRSRAKVQKNGRETASKVSEPIAPALNGLRVPAVAAPTLPKGATVQGVTAQSTPAQAAPVQESAGLDFDTLSRNVARFIDSGSKVAAAYLRPMESNGVNGGVADTAADAVRTLGHVAEYWMADPARTAEAQTRLASDFLQLWSNTLRRMSGEEVQPVAGIEPADKRFADPKWRESPIYDFVAQAYMITTRWAQEMVREADVDNTTRDKAQFFVRQIAGAVSPSNFVATNPVLLEQTLAENGENLIRGMNMLAQDVEAGEGEVKLRQSDNTAFELGVNLATTPGKVIFRNDLIELLQYEPSTEKVLKRPLLIVPPWINKFYILDLNAEKSFIRWAVSQGVTVFVISWVNPDSRHAAKSFSHYMHEGIFAACEVIEQATGERDVNAIGYCVGGTLLAVALAWQAAQTQPGPLASATFLTTQVDFADPGDLKVFSDEAQIADTEAEMAKKGYLDGSKMANAFNMLRPNDLIWSYVVNNYLKGQAPKPFDLLTWNSDSTRMTAANHSFYLRNCYLENNLSRGRMVVDGVTLNLKKVMTPIYNLAAREDHIAPAASVFRGAQFFGGPMRYVLAGSGHIAGVVNPPKFQKYQYWLGEKPSGAFADWLEKAVEHKGSWWLDWIDWLRENAPEEVAARPVGGGKIKPICDAPGTYVRIKS